MVKEETMNDEALLAAVKRMYFKTSEVLSLMKDGKFIVAHEKLGGVLKNINALGAELQKRVPEDKSDLPDHPAVSKS